MGKLYIVSTPIGNMGDITLRTIEVLKSVDYVLCEDTRVTGRLLNHFEISKKMISLNDFNEESRVTSVIGDLVSGKNIALVSDAGTPLISDPGYKLVRSVIEKDVKVDSIPGPTAAIAALTISGLPPDKFLYLGFLPKKDGKKEEVLKRAKDVTMLIATTVIIYESPFRLLKTLELIKSVFGDISIVVCRELTKLHEEVRREEVSESISHFSKLTPKGEFVILLSDKGL